MKVLDLFSGIGGFSLGLHRAGMQTVAFCEIEKYPQAVLKKNFPGVPIYDDVRTITAEQLRADGIDTVDLVCGGFPCQPFSVAGKQQGKDDHRHLWPEMFRIIQETKPSWVIGENVAGFVSMALSEVCSDLESTGYEVQPVVIPACAVNALHRRDRVWILAYSDAAKQRGQQRKSQIENHVVPYPGLQRPEISKKQAAGPDWTTESPFCGVANGISRRVDRLKCLGNAVVPQIPEIIGRAIMQTELAARPMAQKDL
jgi:DNA (cytosine-5)-methyltransferase 1